ncbi:MAG: lactate racemase domain-containing protein [Candidatus Thorarchaeota archaeon]|jgi:nickel-dependent lactate racemase
MRFDVRYGEGFLPLDTGSITPIDEIIPRSVVEPADTTRMITSVLDNLGETESIIQSFLAASSIAIVVDGPESPTPSKLLLDSLLSTMDSIAIDPQNVAIIVTSSGGQIYDSSEADRFLGSPLSRGYRLFIHDPNSDDNIQHIGDTPKYGTPLYLSKWFVEADLKIAMSSIVPDAFAGATGGRMSIIPGISGVRTIARNLKLRTLENIGMFVNESPQNKDLEEASTLSGLDIVVNAVLDWQDSIAEVVAGRPEDAWKQGLDTAKDLAKVYPERRADIAVVSAGGWPADSTLYNAIDSLYTGYLATRHDGVIVLVSECASGPGPSGFVKGISAVESLQDMRFVFDTKFEIGMEKALFLWKVLESRRLIMCSRLKESLVTEGLHCRNVRNPQEGLELALGYVGMGSNVVFLPHGRRISINIE